MFGTTRLLLTVLALDTLRNIVENTYFGFYFGGQYGLLPAQVADVLGTPVLLILPKLLNVLAGCLVLTILLFHWLPSAIRERDTAEHTTNVLREMATHDGLTGLLNRREFLTMGESEWERSQRYDRPLSVLMLDIDLFKLVNDRYGHSVGDQVIIRVAEACQAFSRTVDIAARLGGEEFVVLLPETRADDAGVLAERLRKGISELKLVQNGEEIATTVSIGVSEAKDLDSFAALLKAADIALYDAKRSGRNQVCAFDPSLPEHGDKYESSTTSF
jgi:diguanylate cyclase (GGDEF)-like protein